MLACLRPHALRRAGSYSDPLPVISYVMANAANPGLDIVDFLSPDLFRREFAMAAPYQRGERINAFVPCLTFQRY